MAMPNRWSWDTTVLTAVWLLTVVDTWYGC